MEITVVQNSDDPGQNVREGKADQKERKEQPSKKKK